MPENTLRHLPSIDLLLRRERIQTLIREMGRENVRDRLRETMAEIRRQLAAGRNGHEHQPVDLTEQLAREIEAALFVQIDRSRLAGVREVINATGVILHTNLGRAPLGPRAIQAVGEAAAGYCNLEYDLDTGKRGKRGTGLVATLRGMLGCEAAAVVNNCAAAVLIVLNTLAEGGEVIVSRGELVEIGGSFRIPDVITRSGARLCEVGTTNRTRLADYEKAINENTRVILRAHPSNYRVTGFTERADLADLAALARKHNLILFEDLGSGNMVDLQARGIRDEPTVAQSLAAGAHVVAFSGDKLLGGPQSGIILGQAALIDRIKGNPLMRALRVDKMIFAALESTLQSYVRGKAIEEIPALSMLFTEKEQIEGRARAFIRRAKKLTRDRRPDCQWELLDGLSVIGGGTTPGAGLPTKLIAMQSASLSAEKMEEHLRRQAVPVIVRIEEGRVLLDLRTVFPAQEKIMLESIAAMLAAQVS
ncbi:MAG: L-seryl-tRNA(Sec) selenium transferase [Blastocatellia bacterium]